MSVENHLFKEMQRRENRMLIEKALESAPFFLSEIQTPLEDKLKDFTDMPNVELVKHKEDALRIALHALDIKENTLVFLPVLAPIFVLRIIYEFDLVPVFIENHTKTYTLDIRDLQMALMQTKVLEEKKVALLLSIDQFTLPCDYFAIHKITKKYHLKHIELCLDGLGSSIGKQKTPSFADIGICEFHPNASIRTIFEAAAIFTNDDYLAENIQLWKGSGYSFSSTGFKVLGLQSQVHPMDAWTIFQSFRTFETIEMDRRLELASFYSSSLLEVLDPPFIPAGFHSAWTSYPILLPIKSTRHKFVSLLAEKDVTVETCPLYDLDKIDQEINKNRNVFKRDFRLSRQVKEQMVLLPFHPYIEIKEAKYICETVKSVISHIRKSRGE